MFCDPTRPRLWEGEGRAATFGVFSPDQVPLLVGRERKQTLRPRVRLGDDAEAIGASGEMVESVPPTGCRQ
jgi:hypothetical protein